ncbi:MAG: dehydrogenase [Bacteroidetes bacterium]|jgi:2-oxoisovalerate dehydrogenase E1 component|nr:dehydrogenase [Bacteroidota bacterium]
MASSNIDYYLDIDLNALYQALLLPRCVEEKMLRLIRQGRISKWFSGYGQEAIAVGCTWALRSDDYILPTHRNLGVWTTREVPLRALMCQLMGRAGGFTKGRDRTFHFGLPEKRIIGMISHMAAMLPVACGLGQAAQLKGEDTVALAFCGDGASREGDFHEALNLAAVWQLPVVFVVENNGYGLSTPTDEAMAVERIADAGAGYGMPGESVDGNNVLAVIEAVRRSAARARTGEGPTLLEMRTFRVRGHEEASGTAYVPDERIEAWEQKDPVARFSKALVRQGILTPDDVEALADDLMDDVTDAVEYALAQPEVSSDRATERADVFAPPQPSSAANGTAANGSKAPIPAREATAAETGDVKEFRFVDATREALWQAMEADDAVVLLGQDIGTYGGVFKVTEGFIEAFGRERVRDTPIIESGAVGAAMGLALRDLRPVLEIQYADFISCGFNQIVNNLATTHYRWGQPLNVTIRAPYGGGIGAGPFHSQAREAWFCHVPGLKVVIPSTPADIKGLLLSAIDDPNPVLVFEHKALYRSVKGTAPTAPVRVPLGKARIAREGTDATIVTYGQGVHWAVDAAEAQAEMTGASVEVVDLRTLTPWDRTAVLASVRKTHRVLVLQEATHTGGFGGELAATIAEDAFAHLDAPPVRVGALDTPVPFSTSLEEKVFSARTELAAALERLLNF